MNTRAISIEPPADGCDGFAAAFEELLVLVESGALTSVGLCVRLPDGSSHEIPIGESADERAVILHRLRRTMRRSLH